MKKVFSLISLAFAALTLNAQGISWDFTKWSQSTLNALHEDMVNNKEANWRNYESDATKADEQHYWISRKMAGALVTNAGPGSENDTIPETKGLVFGASAAKKLVITYNHNNREEHGQFLWFNGKNETLTAPGIVGGQKLKIAIESHSSTEARGFTITFNGTALVSPTGNFTPIEYTEYELDLPEGEGDLVFKTTNGCHLFYIIVGNGSNPTDDIPVQENVAYIYDSSYNLENGYGKNGGLDSDPIYTYLADACVVSVVDLNSDSIKAMTTAQVNDSLLKYDVVVLSEAVGSGNAYAKAMVEIVNKVPMLNFKSYMYKNTAWNVGAGANPSPKATSLVFNEDLIESELVAALLNEIDMESTELAIFENAEPAFGNLIQGYTTTPGSMFENDEVIATVGDGIKAVHAHGGKRNTYLLLPFSSDNLTFDDLTDDAMAMAVNAVKYLATTKTKVSPAATPTVSMDYQDGKTIVTLACATKGSSVYYALDGSDPTVTSTLYTDPFEVTVDSTIVKAFAIAQGYDNSAVATKIVSVMSQAAAPEIAVVTGEGKTTVTLTGDATTNIYFSFNGVTTVAGAALYDNKTPLELREPATITYFAASDKLLPSEIKTCDIEVFGISAVKDTVAHFTANETDWFTNAVILDYKKDTLETPTSNWAAKAAYYWGKSAWSCYSTTEVDSVVTLKNELGEVIKCVDGVTDSTKTYYKLDPQAVKYVASTSDTQWILRSQGQLFTGETSESASYIVGNGETGYYAESAFDLIGQPSKGKMTFGGKVSGEPYNASIESTEKFQAPFDVVTYTTNGGGSAFIVVLQTSVDGETWSNVDTLTCAATQRYYVKDRMHVEGSEPVYVRLVQTAGSTKAQLYDIYVITTDGVTGIETISTNADVNVNNRIFDLQGREVRSMVRGQIYIQNGKKVVVK